MSFLIDYIEGLQNKTKETRQRILWLAVAICMLVIFALWVFSLKYSIKKAAEDSQGNELVPQDAKESFQAFKEQIPTIKSNIEAGIGNLFQQGQSEPSPFESNDTTQNNNSE